MHSPSSFARRWLRRHAKYLRFEQHSSVGIRRSVARKVVFVGLTLVTNDRFRIEAMSLVSMHRLLVVLQIRAKSGEMRESD